MPRSEHGAAKTVGVAALVSALVLIAASGLALVLLGIGNRIGEAPEQAVPATVYGQVTSDPIVDEVLGRVSIRASRYLTVDALGTVTRNGLAANTSVETEGSVIATVDERATFVLLGAIPAFRPIAAGSEGADVSQLQQALDRAGFAVEDRDGLYGDSTARALYQFLQGKEITPLTATGEPVRRDWRSTGVPENQIVFVPSFPVTAETQCGAAGDAISDQLCVLASGPATAVFEVPRVDASRLQPGMPIELLVGDGPAVAGTLGDVSSTPPETPADSETPDSPANDTTIEFAVTIENAPPFLAGQEGSGRVILAQSAPDTFRVEGIAIRNRDTGQASLMLANGSEVPVELDMCASGYCSVRSDELATNTSVILAGTPNSTEARDD